MLSLSSAAATDSFEIAKLYLQEQGYQLAIPLDPAEYHGRDDHLFASHPSAARVQALHQVLVDPEIAAVINVRGGYGAMELLPQIDFELFKLHPKIFVGFSDNTSILLAAEKWTAGRFIHGPTALALSNIKIDQDAADSAKMLLKFLSNKISNPFEMTDLQFFAGKLSSAEGTLIGGNLLMLSSLLGTTWMPDLKGKILFIEETKEQPYRVHRALVQLKLAGKLSDLAAVMLGDFKTCTHPYSLGPSIETTLKSFFKDADYPVFSGLPCGHLGLNYPLPIGLRAEVSEGGEITLLENFFQ